MKLSVIIPAYNAEKSIKTCLLSLSESGCEDMEMLVIDDGSADGTAATVTELAAVDRRIRLVTKQNGGVSSARNMGIDLAEGELLMFLDSDDTHSKGMCKKLSESMEKHDSDIAFCGYNEIFEGKARKVLCPASEILVGQGQIFQKFVKPLAFSGTNGFMGSVCFCLFKKELILQNKIRFDERIKHAEDLLFLTEYLLNCSRMSVVPEALYNYELGDGSATKKYFAGLQENNRLLRERFDGLVEEFSLSVDTNTRNAGLVGSVFSLLVNEARAGNPKSFFAQVGTAFRVGREYKQGIKALKPSGRTLKIKRIIAKNGFLRVCFFLIRRVQRAMGVYF